MAKSLAESDTAVKNTTSAYEEAAKKYGATKERFTASMNRPQFNVGNMAKAGLTGAAIGGTLSAISQLKEKHGDDPNWHWWEHPVEVAQAAAPGAARFGATGAGIVAGKSILDTAAKAASSARSLPIRLVGNAGGKILSKAFPALGTVTAAATGIKDAYDYNKDPRVYNKTWVGSRFGGDKALMVREGLNAFEGATSATGFGTVVALPVAAIDVIGRALGAF
jgi:hypothetical protein